MLYRITYIFSWSLGLLFATFPHLFDGGMTFDYRDMLLSEACDKYIFPFIMAMILFLIDVVYGYVKEIPSREYTHVISVIVFLILFLLTFVLSVYVSDPFWACGCFIISWVCLSFMKFLKTEVYETTSYPDATTIDDN